MKNIFILAAIVFTYTNLSAQGIPVSHSIEKKNVVLEDFTGIHCVNCPNGHYYANQLLANHPDDVVLIMVHTGSYAVPSGNEPDFRTSFGTALENASDLTGYPSATINRHIFPALNGGTTRTAIVNRGYWSVAANEILAENAAANLGVEATIDVQTNLLTVRVQLYYTGNPAYPSNNRINVAVLQDGLEGPQTGMANNPDQILPNGNYLHQHVLRHLVTGQWGVKIPVTVGAGITINDTFTYSLPADIRNIPVEIGKLKIAAFVTDGTNEVITGHAISPTFVNFVSAHSSKLLSAVVKDAVICGFTAEPVVTIQNFGSSPLTSLYLDYSINSSPVKTMYWTGNIGSMETKEITVDGINFFQQSANTLTLNTRLPNGVPDVDSVNDEAIHNFNLTPAPDVSTTINMSLQLDYYGAEVEWQLINSSGTVLYSGGPYTNTANPSSNPPFPALISHTFNLDAEECYKFIIDDSYGDGILGTNKGFTLVDDQNYTLASNLADYGSGAVIVFGIDAPVADSSDVFPVDTTDTTDTTGTTGLISPKSRGIFVYPNPSNGSINVDMTFAYDKVSAIYLTDILGKRVQTISVNEKTTNNFVQISVAELHPGIYFLNAEADGKRFTEKILVTR